MNLKVTVFLYFLLITKTFIFSQKMWDVELYNEEDGISQIDIKDIIEDKYGYIWVATINGIYRFDGYEYINYNFENPVVNQVFLDGADNLWVNTGEVYKFNYENKSFEWVKEINEKVTTAISTSLNGFYIPGTKHIFQVETNNNVLKVSKIIAPSEILPCNKLFVDANKRFWALDRKVISLLQQKSDSLVLVKKIKIGNCDVNNCILNSDNNIWISTRGKGLMVFNEEKLEFTKNNFITSIELNQMLSGIYVRNDTSWWIDNNNKIVEINPVSKKIVQQVSLQSKGFELKDINFNCKYFDSFGNWWLGTNYGLGKVSSKSNKFKTIQIPPNFIGEKSKRITSLFELNDSTLLLGTKDGIVIYSLPNKEFEHFSNIPESRNLYTNSSSFCFNKINDNLLAVGGVGLTIIDFKNKHVYNVGVNDNNVSKGIAHWVVWALKFDPGSQDLWVGTNGGLSKTNLTDLLNKTTFRNSNFENSKIDLEFTHYFHSPKDTESIGSDFIYFIGLSPTNDVIITHKEGVSFYNNEENNFINHPTLRTKGTYVEVDKNNNLWLCTEGKGLFRMRYDSISKNYAIIENITIDNGLPSNIIWGIAAINNENIWVGTSAGLSLYKPKTKEIINFNKDDGLQSNEFSRNCFFLGESGRLYYAGSVGANYFIPDQLSFNETLPKLILEELFVHNQKVDPGSKVNGNVILNTNISNTSQIILNHKNNDFAITFIGLLYTIPEKIQYKYLLENYDQKWTYASANNRKAYYMNLKQGKYVFKVMACNEDGKWIQSPIELSIIISPPFWKTWWFKLLIILLIATLIFAYVQIKSVRMKKMNILLSRLVRERTKEVIEQKESLTILNATKDKFFSIIAHDLRNPFQAIVGTTSIILDRFEKLDSKRIKELVSMINTSSGSASDLLENLLQWSRSQSGKIEYQPQPIQLNDFINNVLSLLRVQAEKKSIELVTTSIPEICFVSDINMMHTIIRNFISNALKFTPQNGLVEIGLNIKGDRLIFSVKDNGIGMDQSEIDRLFKIEKNKSIKGTSGEAGTGLGLIICNDFAKMLKGNIQVASEKGKGSEFILSIPYIQSEEKEIIQQSKSNNILEDRIYPVHNKTLEKLEEIAEEKAINLNGKYEILVIDDIDEIRSNIVENLKETFILHEANNGKDGMKHAIEKLPDLIISDIMMPEINGLDLALELKNNEKTSHIPIILLTARDAEKNIIEGIRAGADDYITKPFNQLILQEKVINLIHNRNNLKKQFSKIFITEPSEIIIENTEEILLRNALQLIEDKMDDPSFGLEEFTSEMGLSKTQLYRKIKALTDFSPIELLTNMRLKKAAQYLVKTDKQINEIAYITGYNDSGVFRKQFKKLFNVSPGEYASIHKNK